MSLDIGVEHVGDTATISVKGDVTIQTSSLLRKELKPLFASEDTCIQVKLDSVDFMDSSGIAVLVEGLQWSKATGGKFILSGLTPTVRDVFELAKLDTIFDIKD